MKTATVRKLRILCAGPLLWIKAGKKILVSRFGIVISRLCPETRQTAHVVKWAGAPEVRRNRNQEEVLSAEQSRELIADAGGKW